MKNNGKDPKEIYNGLRTKKNEVDLLVVLQRSTGVYIKYRRGAAVTVMSQDIEGKWDGFDNFADTHTLDALSGMHKELFGKAIPKGMVKDEVALMVWAKIIARAKDRTDLGGGETINKEGKRGPRESLGDRIYIFALERYNKEEKLPKQVHAIMEAVQTYFQSSKNEDDHDQGNPAILEKELRPVIEQAAKNGVLTTKQDPWRIFSYYRPMLVQNGLVKHD